MSIPTPGEKFAWYGDDPQPTSQMFHVAPEGPTVRECPPWLKPEPGSIPKIELTSTGQHADRQPFTPREAFLTLNQEQAEKDVIQRGLPEGITGDQVHEIIADAFS